MKLQRTLPPSAAPISWSELLEGLRSLGRSQASIRQREAEFRTYFGIKHVWFVSSGKAALTLILRAIHGLSGRRKVIIPGYTCFSVPSAVARAQLSVALCDLDLHTLDFDFAQLTQRVDSEVLCVLATHLFGLGVDVPRAIELCKQRGIFVVEDVAQAFGGDRDGIKFGAMGDVSFLSFGRGKNVTCGSGGAILTNSDRIGEAVAREYQQVPQESLLGMLRNWLEVAATKVLINPSLYWLPAGLPNLKLGETTFDTDFPVARMDPVRAGLLRNWAKRLTHSTASRMAHAEELSRSLVSEGVQMMKPPARGRSVYLRLPVLMRSKQEKEALCRQSGHQGLGVSSMYPSPIRSIPELREELMTQDSPKSTILAERLITLPTHELLTAQDLRRICNAIHGLQRAEGTKPNYTSSARGERHNNRPAAS